MMEQPLRLILVRHGEVQNPEGVFYGQQDVPLTERGRLQSLETARRLARLPLDRVVSSDLSRCLFLARALSGRAGCPLDATSGLREVDFGQWTGLSWTEIEKKFPGAFGQRMADLAGFNPPDGESLLDVSKRVYVVLSRLLDRYARGGGGGTVAMIAHAGINRILIARAIGLPLEKVFSLDQEFACTNILDLYPDGPGVLRCLNVPLYKKAIPW